MRVSTYIERAKWRVGLHAKPRFHFYITSDKLVVLTRVVIVYFTIMIGRCQYDRSSEVKCFSQIAISFRIKPAWR
jgi:hypothetical protein